MQGGMGAAGPASARGGGSAWLTVIARVAFGCAVLFSGCVTLSGRRFAYEATCGPNPPTEWRLECTYVALAASALCLVVALVLLLHGRRVGTWLALLFACVSLGASLIGWALPVLASALC